MTSRAELCNKIRELSLRDQGGQHRYLAQAAEEIEVLQKQVKRFYFALDNCRAVATQGLRKSREQTGDNEPFTANEIILWQIKNTCHEAGLIGDNDTIHPANCK